MTNKELQEGEEYLSIAIDVDYLVAKVQRALINKEEKIFLPAFKNEITKDTQPIYRSDVLAIWKKKKIVKKENI